MVGQAEQMKNEWLQHRNVLEELLQTIPDEQTDFKPWDGAMSLGQLSLHVAYWADAFVTMVKTGNNMGEYIESEPNVNDCKSMADVRREVHQWTEKTRQTYESLTDSELEIENDSPYPKLHGTRKKYLALLHDHEIHHKGQLYVYARLVGVKEVPFFY